MRTLFGMMRTLVGISVAVFIIVTVWSNFPIHAQNQSGSTFDPPAKQFKN